MDYVHTTVRVAAIILQQSATTGHMTNTWRRYKAWRTVVDLLGNDVIVVEINCLVDPFKAKCSEIYDLSLTWSSPKTIAGIFFPPWLFFFREKTYVLEMYYVLQAEFRKSTKKKKATWLIFFFFFKLRLMSFFPQENVVLYQSVHMKAVSASNTPHERKDCYRAILLWSWWKLFQTAFL